MVTIGQYKNGKFIPNEPEVEHRYYIDEHGMVRIDTEKKE